MHSIRCQDDTHSGRISCTMASAPVTVTTLNRCSFALCCSVRLEALLTKDETLHRSSVCGHGGEPVSMTACEAGTCIDLRWVAGSPRENSDQWLEIQTRKLPPTQLKTWKLVSKYGHAQRMRQLTRQIWMTMDSCLAGRNIVDALPSSKNPNWLSRILPFALAATRDHT
jgi:hypothetical protein